MLKIIVQATEFYDERINEFIKVPEQALCLEHSLISLQRWESKYKKPYLTKTPKNRLEVLEYIRCMSVNKEISLETVMALTDKQLMEINKYIEDPMTATTFRKEDAPPSREILTAEVIYWQMKVNQIPFECEKWHLNRLFTLIRVCGIKDQKPKNMSKKELMARNRQLNQSRRARTNSKG